MKKEEIKKVSVLLLRKIADHLEKEEFEEVQKYIGTEPIGDGDDCCHFINFDLGESATIFGQTFAIQNNIQDIVDKLKS